MINNDIFINLLNKSRMDLQIIKSPQYSATGFVNPSC